MNDFLEDEHEGSMAGALNGPITVRDPETPVVCKTIEKILSIVWIGPHDPPTECIDSWVSKHPTWTVQIWKDHKGWRNQTQIDAMREWNGKADLMRLEILAKHGGIVVDADSLCLRALEEGPEDFLANETAFAFYENETARPGTIGCGVMGAPAGSAFFTECVKRAAGKDMAKPAWTTVGPLLISEVAKSMPSEIKVYPAKWVHPYHFSGTEAPGVRDVKPYCDQQWGGTRGYNRLRKMQCSCQECRSGAGMIRPWM